MARKSDRLSTLVAVVPALLGVIAGASSFLVAFAGSFSPGDLGRIREFLTNPLSVGAVAVYSSVILAITTVIIYQLARATRTTDVKGTPQEPDSSPEASAIETPEPPLSPEEVATREQRRNLTGIKVAFTRNRRRMIEEADRLQRNGFLNLMIGILFSVIALGILGYPLFSPNSAHDGSWIGLFERFAPRFSVGILIQLIGFFFLRLYVAGENEIHYIRNEVTNLESRLISYLVATVRNDAAATRDIIKQLVRTERNFKLKKGERTLYSTDETYNDMRQVLKDTAEIARAKSSK